MIIQCMPNMLVIMFCNKDSRQGQERKEQKHYENLPMQYSDFLKVKNEKFTVENV